MNEMVSFPWKGSLLDASSPFQGEFLEEMGIWVSFVDENSPWRVFLLSGSYCTCTNIEYTGFSICHMYYIGMRVILPAKYAPMSLTMTKEQGSRNQMIPSNMLETKNEDGMKTNRRMRWTHAYCRNCTNRCPLSSLNTNAISPARNDQNP